MFDMAFFRGETVVFALAAVNDDGTPLTSPEAAVVTIVLSNQHGGPIDAQYSTAPHVVNSTASTFVFTFEPSDYLPIGRPDIHYNIWSVSGGITRLQQRGKINLITTSEVA